jgi:hypothetical protein
MIIELGNELVGFCNGDNTGLVPTMADSEAGNAARDALFAELRGDGKPAQGATEGKKMSRQELRQTKRKADKETKRRCDDAQGQSSPLSSWRLGFGRPLQARSSYQVA